MVERDQDLLQTAICVLEHAIDLHPDVRSAFNEVPPWLDHGLP